MSAKKSSFVAQAAILAVAGFIVRFIGFLYRVPLTRLIGDEGNDIYSSGYLIYTFFLILSSAGVPAAISKMVSERLLRKEYMNAHRVFKGAMLLVGGMGLFAATLLGVFAKPLSAYVESSASYYSILVLCPTVFIVSLMSVFRGYFQGMKNTVPTAVSQIIEQIFNAVFSVLLAYILIKYGLEYGAAGGNAGTGIGALFGLFSLIIIYMMFKPRYKKYITRGNTAHVEPYSHIIKEVAGTALPIIIGTAIFSMTNLIDLKMVKSLLYASKAFTDSEVSKMYGQLTGKFTVLTTLPVAIASSLATAIVPNVAEARALNDTRQVKEKVRAALKLTMIVCIPSAVGIGVLGDQILMMLFQKYYEGGILLKAGSACIIFLSLAQISTGILQGMGMLKIPAFAAICGALVKIPLNVVLISNPKINVVGAVISTIACYVVASAIDMTCMIRQTGVMPDFTEIFIKPLAASGAMGISCYVFYYFFYMLIGSVTFSCLLAIFLGIVVYVVYMLLLKGFNREDFKYIPMGNKLLVFFGRFGLI